MREIFEPEHESFRSTVRSFLEKEVTPHHEQWEKDGVVDRSVWTKAGELGLLCFDVDEQYGGAGVKDFRYNMVMAEELTRAGANGPGFLVHTDIIVPYISSLGTPQGLQGSSGVAPCAPRAPQRTPRTPAHHAHPSAPRTAQRRTTHPLRTAPE